MTAGRTSDRRRPSWGALRENAAFVVFAMGAIVVTFDLFVWGYGEDPSSMLRLLAFGTWGTAYGIGQVLFKATPILFTGVAVDVALRAGLFNIGAEGQLVMGSLVGALVGAALPAGTPWFVALPLVLSSAAAAGAAWALVPAWLRARYGAHEVIASIMMNRIAASLVAWAMARGAALPGSVRTRDVVPGARLPRIDTLLPVFAGSAASFAILLSVILAVVVAVVFRRTVVGIETTQVGLNPEACRAAGIDVRSRMTVAFVASGALAGLAASATVFGYKGYYEEGLGGGAGFLGLAVALLARQRVSGFVFAALLFGTLAQGGLVVNAYVPMEVMDLLVGVVILAVAMADARAGSSFARVTGANDASDGSGGR